MRFRLGQRRLATVLFTMLYRLVEELRLVPCHASLGFRDVQDLEGKVVESADACIAEA